jgi:hypothetical protein
MKTDISGDAIRRRVELGLWNGVVENVTIRTFAVRDGRALVGWESTAHSDGSGALLDHGDFFGWEGKVQS